MRLPKRALIPPIALIAILASYVARSDTPTRSAVNSESRAFHAPWTGEFYIEPNPGMNSPVFDTFEAKQRYYLESPAIELVEEDTNEEGWPDPSPSPTPPPDFSANWIVPYEWDRKPPPPFSFRDLLVRPAASPSPSPSPSPSALPLLKPQARFYYDRGSLRDASQLEREGKGFVKIFQDRDQRLGGRAWGTRSMIDLITRTAADFADRYPGRERLQIADISRKNGRNIGHGSHQNGLDADIVYIRKIPREQPITGGYGKNGFAEQFVRTTVTTRVFRDKQGKKRRAKAYSLAPSENFDVEANFYLLLMFSCAGNVKTYFMDKVLIREIFRYAETRSLNEDHDVRAMLMKLDAERSHADHFHLRLVCQPGDTRCVSANSSSARRSARK